MSENQVEQPVYDPTEDFDPNEKIDPELVELGARAAEQLLANQPKRKGQTFVQAFGSRSFKAIQQIIDDVPELDAAMVIPCWQMDLNQSVPTQVLVRGSGVPEGLPLETLFGLHNQMTAALNNLTASIKQGLAEAVGMNNQLQQRLAQLEAQLKSKEQPTPPATA